MSQESFPRGGKKLGIKRSADWSFEEKLKPKKHKTQTKKKNGHLTTEATNLVATTADRLSKTMLHQGLIILARVSVVSEYDLKLSLPGGLIGYVKVTDLSQSYTNLLQNIVDTKTMQSSEFKPLSDLFKPGDYVTCYVKMLTNTVSKNGKENFICDLSMEPQLINQNVRANYLTKGAKLVCTVKSIEDHGYTVDTGITNVRAFIATENVAKGKQYFPGTQLLCAIKEIETTNNTSIIKLSTKKKKIDSVKTCDIISLDALTPGTKLTLYITKILSNGLRITFGKDNNVGYLNRIYLNNPLSMYEENMEITGTLLYILPTVKLAYFSELTDALEKEVFNVGDVIEKAKVLYRESHKAILKLSKSGLRGYISLRRTNVQITKFPTKFKEGTTHRCRILAYDWMEHVYICSVEEEILKEKYFSVRDINIGDILTVTVYQLTDEFRGYINVQVGKIKGIVPQEHISDAGLSGLRKLKDGDNITARVLDKNNDKNQAKFTLKQSLIKSYLPVLYDFDKVECGVKYHGTISMINKNGLLIRFYGKVKGWVPRTLLNKDTYNMNWNFFVGGTVTVCVESVEKDSQKMKLKIITEEKEEFVDFSIGEMVDGTVIESSPKGVHLKIQKDGNETAITGFLPTGHMAPCYEIGNLLASRCVPGNVMSAVVFATKPAVILSRTFVTNEKYSSFDLLKVGDCIPCTVRDILQNGVSVVLPIEDYSKLEFISYKNISNFDRLYLNQILFVKITAINKQKRQLTLSMLLKDIWEGPSDYEIKLLAAVDVLNLYLSTLSELANSTYYENRPISSVTLGQKIHGTVTEITENGLLLELNDRLTGVVRRDHYSGEPQVGDKVFGTILWKNYVHEFVDVSLLPNIINGISSKQKTLPELPTAVTLKAEILMITNWLILVLVKRNGVGYLVALPARRHINDISPDLTPYKIHSKIRLYVVMTRKESKIVPIAMLKSAFETSKDINVSELSSKRKQQLKKKKMPQSHDADLDSLKKPPREISKKVTKKVSKKTLKKGNETKKLN
ncbi:rRNA biogenesis protein RRP5-like [Cardiocondyla obscurior]|uniref:rRNA biogenesis protein RRP5-like n=1 Tax=Cardiocondyla obscurior TaxID=286306 RepID=UPI0039656FED